MTDISITPGSVTWVSGVRWETGMGGEAGTAGQAVYLDTTTNTLKLTDGDNDATSVFKGVLLDTMVSGRPCIYAPPGAVINIGGTVVLGTVYVFSLTAGGIAPWADLGTGDYVTIVFIGATSNIVEVIGKRQYAGVHA